METDRSDSGRLNRAGGSHDEGLERVVAGSANWALACGARPADVRTHDAILRPRPATTLSLFD